jgi:hypothetical protein
MIINLSNFNDALPIIVRDDDTFEKLKTDFPDILADLVTFKSNPNCSCRGRVMKFFGDQLNQNPDLLDKYVKDANVLNQEIQTIISSRIANTYTGKVFIIPKGEDSWQNFSATLVGKMFRGFSVVERDSSLVVYFL